MNASFSTREQLGQLMMFNVPRPKSTTLRTRPAAISARMERPATISSLLLAERDADGVAEAAADQLLEGDARLDDTVGREAGFRDAEMQRHVGPLFGKAFIDFDHLRRIGIFQRDDIAREAERVE